MESKSKSSKNEFLQVSNSYLFFIQLFQIIGFILSMSSLSLFSLFLLQNTLHSILNISLNTLLPEIDSTFIKKNILNIENIYFHNMLLYSLFFIQHILMSRSFFKDAMQKLTKYYFFIERYIFISLASLTLSIIIFYHKHDDYVLIKFNNIYLDIFLFIINLLHLFISLYIVFVDMKDSDILGIGILKKIKKEKGSNYPIEFTEKKSSLLSLMMRHPLYYSTLVLIWTSSSIISRGRFFFNCQMTIFIIVGTFFEEREILKKYPSYINYVKKVPNKFIPNIFVLFDKEKNN